MTVTLHNPAPGSTLGLRFGLARPWTVRPRLKAGACVALAFAATPVVGEALYTCSTVTACTTIGGCSADSTAVQMRVIPDQQRLFFGRDLSLELQTSPDGAQLAAFGMSASGEGISSFILFNDDQFVLTASGKFSRPGREAYGIATYGTCEVIE